MTIRACLAREAWNGQVVVEARIFPPWVGGPRVGSVQPLTHRAHMNLTRRGFLCGTLSGLSMLAGWRALGQLPDLLGPGKRWLEEQFDPEALAAALRSGDPSQAQALLGEFMERFQGEYVLDLAALQEGAHLALPLLELSPETKPYASWLRARMDYFQVADEFRRTSPTPVGPPGQPPAPPRIPTPYQERQAWRKRMAQQPLPAGAAAWVARLKPVLRSAGAPPELVWLAEIESGFDPQARSPAGAVGIFQLMPATARGLGLKLQPRDERLDADRNARAAGRYLRQLHGQFKDWPLAVAAYNAGPGRVADLLERRRARSYDAIAPSLPAETQLYVPKFEALLKRREGNALSALRSPVPGK